MLYSRPVYFLAYLGIGVATCSGLIVAEEWRARVRKRQPDDFDAWDVSVVVVLWPLLLLGRNRLLGRAPEDRE